MIGRLPRCLRRGPQGKKKRDTLSQSHPRTPENKQGVLPRDERSSLSSLFHPPPRYLRQPQPRNQWVDPTPSTYLRVLQVCKHRYLSICITSTSRSPAESNPLAACQMPLVYAAWLPQRAKSAHSQVTSREPQHALRTSFLNNLTARPPVCLAVCLCLVCLFIRSINLSDHSIYASTAADYLSTTEVSVYLFVCMCPAPIYPIYNVYIYRCVCIFICVHIYIYTYKYIDSIISASSSSSDNSMQAAVAGLVWTARGRECVCTDRYMLTSQRSVLRPSSDDLIHPGRSCAAAWPDWEGIYLFRPIISLPVYYGVCWSAGRLSLVACRLCCQCDRWHVLFPPVPSKPTLVSLTSLLGQRP